MIINYKIIIHTDYSRAELLSHSDAHAAFYESFVALTANYICAKVAQRTDRELHLQHILYILYIVNEWDVKWTRDAFSTIIDYLSDRWPLTSVERTTLNGETDYGHITLL
jgi:hypothetical protein